MSNMSDTSETSTAILAHLFCDPDAILGTKWLNLVATGWTDDCLTPTGHQRWYIKCE